MMASNIGLNERVVKFKSGLPSRIVQVIGLLRRETPPGLAAADVAGELRLEESVAESSLSELCSLGVVKKEGSLFSISGSDQARLALDKLLRLYDRLAAREPICRILKGLLEGGPVEECVLMEAIRRVPLDEQDLAPVLEAELKAWRIGLIKLLIANGELRLIGMSRRFPKPGTLSIDSYEKEKERLSASGAQLSERTFYAGFYPPEALRQGKAILLAHFPEVAAYLEEKRRSLPAFPKWL